jgi:4-hydroxy-4-methyl-2-oxoglutarate aldolase
VRVPADQPLGRSASDALAIRERFLALDASVVADALDQTGLFDQGLSPDFTEFPALGHKLAGWAFTVRGEMGPYDGESGDPLKMEVCDQSPPGSICVWAGAGRGVCFFGELIATRMKALGSAGALVDGGVRDTGPVGRMGYPVFARFRSPIQSIGRWRVVETGVPVSLPGATSEHVKVSPGDFVLGDGDGVVVIPADVVSAVLQRAESLASQEALVRSELLAGASLAASLKKFGHI